ncbi:MAG: hypothetical protein H7707_03805, partial [Acetobacter sp.]|nr:hypothetical protein [Acetobacter sp.]
MSIEIKVPTLGESVTSATVGKWLKQPGEAVNEGDSIVSLETDKVNVDVPAPESGVLGAHAVKEGDEVAVGALLTTLQPGQVSSTSASKTVASPTPPPKTTNQQIHTTE